MRVVIAVDSFKGSVSAPVACQAIADGMLTVANDIEIVLRPMADGGEGTAAVMLSVMDGAWVERRVAGPLPGREVDAGFAWFPQTRTALVEMAAASGLVLLDTAERDPMRTTTFGTGELVAAATEHGAERILLTVGGSATVDGGAGAAAALGWVLRDGQGHVLPVGGGALRRLRSVTFDGEPSWPPIDVLCDVGNPLLGAQGAARIYGPQKGATVETIPLLEAGLERVAHCVLTATGRDMREISGGGAAGGLAAGAYGFLGASLTRGADTVSAAIGLSEAVRGADWVISGEGAFDGQSAQGKVVSAVVGVGRAAGVRTAVIAGRVEVDDAEIRGLGIDAVVQSSPADMPVEEAMRAGASLLFDAGRTFARLHLDG